MTHPKRPPSSPPPNPPSAPKFQRTLRSNPSALSLHSPLPSPPPPPRPSLISTTNAIPHSVFTQRFLPQPLLAHLTTTHHLTAQFAPWSALSPATRTACLDLVEQTSGEHYAMSRKGWDRKRKEREMGHVAMRYLVLFAAGDDSSKDGEGGNGGGDGGGKVQGFLSFMITDEDGWDVIYCYEVHLVVGLRGKGVGRDLMRLMEMVGGRVGVDKAMLTVFTANEAAVKAYRGWGYGVDEFSPRARRVKGKVKEPEYVILSKCREEFAVEEQRVGDGENGSGEAET